MNLEATIITDSTELVIANDKSSIGRAPALEMPALAGVLLVEPKISAPAGAPVEVASLEMPSVLPETASSLPLVGMLGVLSVAASAGLGFARRRVKLPQA